MDFTGISNNFYSTAWKSFLTWSPDWTYSTASAGQKAWWSVVFHSLTWLLQIQVLEDWLSMEVGKFRSYASLKGWGYYIDPDNFSCKFSSLSKPIPDAIPNGVYSCLLFIVELQRPIASVVLMLSLASA